MPYNSSTVYPTLPAADCTTSNSASRTVTRGQPSRVSFIANTKSGKAIAKREAVAVNGGKP
jgi:hypothetical protein